MIWYDSEIGAIEREYEINVSDFDILTQFKWRSLAHSAQNRQRDRKKLAPIRINKTIESDFRAANSAIERISP